MPEKPVALNSFPSVGQRIRSVRGFSSLNRKSFALKHDISEATLKSWEQAETSLRETSFQRLLGAFKAEGIMCTKEWLLTGEGTPPYKLGKGAPSSQEKSSDQGGDLLAEVAFFLKNNSQGMVYQISEGGMEPFYSIGDYVGGLLVPLQKAFKNHRPYIVTLATGEKKVRTVFEEKDGYLLSQTDPLYCREQIFIDKKRVLSFHEILWHRRASDNS